MNEGVRSPDRNSFTTAQCSAPSLNAMDTEHSETAFSRVSTDWQLRHNQPQAP
jgi:hypothetical protein